MKNFFDGYIYVNTRNLHNSLTGVQRYTIELLSRWGNRPKKVSPNKKFSSGLAGHIWEQAVLPNILCGALLFSPSNTGPLAIKRQVVTIHDLVSLDHPEWFNARFAAWYRFLIPRLVNRVQRVITISNFTRERLLQQTKVAPDKIVVIPNGVNARFSPKSVKDIKKIQKALKIPTEHYILSLCSLEPRKNLHNLLRAWVQVQSEIPSDIWLVITGAKGKTLVFKDVSFDPLPPRVWLTGHVRDEYLPALYSGATAFVYVSIYEGFGLPPLEAMASGTPTLTGNITALPEVVSNAAVTVNPFDPDAIAWGIKRLIEDGTLRENLRLKGIQRAKIFSWDTTADMTLQVLLEAMTESS